MEPQGRVHELTDVRIRDWSSAGGAGGIGVFGPEGSFRTSLGVESVRVRPMTRH